ncbi:MAG: hypothetical protein GYA51_11550, partial [Candidatus Methanofastidiosa archaeon]|nr:hypothetical protein [Candidatus Methanofastidiosa archaeon]
MKKMIYFLVLTLGIIACNKNGDNPESSKMEYTFDFNSIGMENWMSFFSDYPVGEENYYELIYEYSNLPEPLDTNIKSLKISGNNHSDDLFCAIYRKFDGLQPNKSYSVTFNIDFASNAPTNAVGVGGSPDLSIGAGGLSFVPNNRIDNLNTYRPNFESKLQSHLSNEFFQVLGTIGVSDNIPTPFMLINRNNLDNPIEIVSNS